LALLVVAAYFDIVVRKDEAERSAVQRAVDAKSLAATIATTVREAVASSGGGTSLAESEGRLVESFTSSVKDLLHNVLEAPLLIADPHDCLHSALSQRLVKHPEAFPHLADCIIGCSVEEVVERANVTFVLTSLNDDFYQVTYTFRGNTRIDTFSAAFVQGSFRAENRIMSSHQFSDTWLFLDESAYQETLNLIAKNRAELRYLNAANIRAVEQRDFRAAEPGLAGPGIVRSSSVTVDLTPPDGARDCEIVVETNVVLPAFPSGLRWIFESPTYVEEIQFDVERLWPSEEIDFTLYPFLLGTDDYTQRSEKRQRTYRIGVHSWLTQGHGVMLAWDRPHVAPPSG
jgi:hypothetical protein